MSEEITPLDHSNRELPGIDESHKKIARVIGSQQVPPVTATEVYKQGLISEYGEQKAADLMAKAKNEPEQSPPVKQKVA